MFLLAKSRQSPCLAIPALLILASVWLFPSPGFSGTYKIYPTADAEVISTYPDDNFGTNQTLDVGKVSPNIYYTYLKFDLSSIPQGERVTGGTLYAYCNDYLYVLAYTYMQLRAVADTTWSELGITWNNKPAYGDTVIASAKASKLPPFWMQWNIPGPNVPTTGLVSFMLSAYYAHSPESLDYGLIFASKENGDISLRPYLQVTTGANMAPITVPLLLGN